MSRGHLAGRFAPFSWFRGLPRRFRPFPLDADALLHRARLGARGRDVVVEAEDIVGVVRGLDPRQSVVRIVAVGFKDLTATSDEALTRLSRSQ